MKKLYKDIFSVSILVLLLILLLNYVYKNQASFLSLRIVDPMLLLILIFLHAISFLFVGLSFRSLLLHFNLKLEIHESFFLAILNGFYNFITPFKGGIFIRAYYLKKKYSFNLQDFSIFLSASFLLIFFLSSFLSLFSIYLLYIFFDFELSFILIIFLILIFLFSLFILTYPKFKLPFSFFKTINNLLLAWYRLRSDFKTIFRYLAYTFLQILVLSYMFFLQFRILGFEINFFSSIFLACFSLLSLIISITPAGLGIQEAVTVFSALSLGITPAESLAAALLGRAVQMIVLFILGPIFSYILLKKVKKN